MISKNLKLVIFDKDGLIMDTEAPVFRMWAEVFSEWGLPPLTKEIYITFIGYGRNDNIKQLGELFPDINPEELFNACATRARDYLENNPIRTMPGLFELLDYLEELGIKKVVATSSRYPNAEMTLKKCNVFHRFDAIISGDMIERTKPAPDIFLKAAEVMEVEPKDCLVLEDSIAGIQAAHAAGIPAIVIPDMVPIPDDIVELCEYKYKNLSAIVSTLPKL